jgi:hypothetical protein
MKKFFLGVLLSALAPVMSLSQSPALAGAPENVCDGSLAKHVYHPARLVVKSPCITVRGTIMDATHGKDATHRKHKDGLRHEPDGDTHGWLKLDPGQENLLNAGNRKKEGGNLVFEVVCKYHVTQEDALAACQDYVSPIVIPPVGTHVCVTGPHVQDQEHAKWMEIHPVYSIEVCK